MGTSLGMMLVGQGQGAGGRQKGCVTRSAAGRLMPDARRADACQGSDAVRRPLWLPPYGMIIAHLPGNGKCCFLAEKRL